MAAIEKTMTAMIVVVFGMAVMAQAVQVLAKPVEPVPPPEPTPGLVNLYGSVVNAITGSPVANAEVSINEHVTYTSASGYYEFLDVDPGTYTLMAEATGYYLLQAEVILTEGNNGVDIQVIPITEVEPSALLVAYQENLETAITSVEHGDSYGWVAVAGGWGLQYAYTVVDGGMTDPETMLVVSTSVKDLMIEEAISIGMMESVSDAYFVGAVMYHVSGDTIVPYWWSCLYCSERFRSLEERDAHIQGVHWKIISATGSVHIIVTENQWGDDVDKIEVAWTNTSSFPMEGYVRVDYHNWQGTYLRVQDTTPRQVANPGESLLFTVSKSGISDRFILKATLIGVVDSFELDLDTAEEYVDVREEE